MANIISPFLIVDALSISIFSANFNKLEGEWDFNSAKESSLIFLRSIWFKSTIVNPYFIRVTNGEYRYRQLI